ncbi:MAG: endonuclease [Bacteroidia bacterium]|nr:endonuclease [Bacteroidia bacterium]
MPEGPSIVILKEQVQKFKNHKVLQVSGNSKLDLSRLRNQKVTDFKSWGKHFLICFKNFTVRIHLMLFGTYRIDEAKESKPRLSLQFTNGELNFYACSVQFIEGDLNEVYNWQADLLSDQWNPRRATKALKAMGDTLVCDALLDQTIFSGSGNIIKCEVLYRIKVHPQNKLKQLPPKKLAELVKEAHQYSYDFLKWKRNFELRKHWLAYKCKTCHRCNLPIKLKVMGKTQRRTFYCDNCQMLYSSR